MEEPKVPSRDEKGDIVFNFKGLDRDTERWWRYTYVFRFHEEKTDRFAPYFQIEKYEEASLNQARSNPTFLETLLYKTPKEPPFDFFIRYHNWQLELKVHYFKEVFEEKAFIEGYMPTHKYSRLIFIKELHDIIINFINDNDLLVIRDLIFEVIAIGQEKYTEEIAYWENEEMQKIINTAPQQSQHVIRLIDKALDKKWLSRPDAKTPAELLRINYRKVLSKNIKNHVNINI